MEKYFAPSELIINPDGSSFHLHLKPEHLADRVILVGDPGRVPVVAAHFEEIENDVASREFRTITGTYKGKRISVQSTGIGCDNIDIVVNELDALANIDFEKRTEKPEHRELTIVRIGTCGGLQPNTPVGTFIASVKSIGFDGLLNFYAGRNDVCDLELEEAFKQHMNWNPQFRYKISGKKNRAKGDGEEILVFDLTSYKCFEKEISEDGKISKRPVFPPGWNGTFGPKYGESNRTLQVNTFDGYTVFSLKGKENNTGTNTGSSNETESPQIAEEQENGLE